MADRKLENITFLVNSASTGSIQGIAGLNMNDQVLPALGNAISDTDAVNKEDLDTAIAGTAQTLSQTLALGNTTGGNNIMISAGDLIRSVSAAIGADMVFLSGSGSTAAGKIRLEVGINDDGPGADFEVIAGAGGTEGGSAAGGKIRLTSGSGNSNNQRSGDISILSGNPDGSGQHGDMFLLESGGGLGIGANSVDASALVSIISTNKGFLQPRMSESQRDAIVSPATGLSVYNSTTGRPNFYDGVKWTSIATATSSKINLTATNNTSTLGLANIYALTGTPTAEVTLTLSANLHIGASPTEVLTYNFKDLTGTADTFNYIISGNIDNLSEVRITVPYGSLTIFSDGTNFWSV